MTPDEAISFIKEHGVVPASANGPVPRLTEVIVNEGVEFSRPSRATERNPKANTATGSDKETGNHTHHLSGPDTRLSPRRCPDKSPAFKPNVGHGRAATDSQEQCRVQKLRRSVSQR